MKSFSLISFVIVSNISTLDAFSVQSKLHQPPSSTNNNEHENNIINNSNTLKNIQKGISTISLTAAIALSTSTATVANANAELIESSLSTDEDTVELVLQNLKDATGDATKSFKVFETVNEIITEGKGVGGSLSYPGVKLERGYVEDEDTTIYNPGLSLLTESEKTSIVNALIQNRKGNIASKTWNADNQYAFEALKMRLDPLHMAELEGYLKVLPFLGGAMYLVALAVQQFARGIFEAAYIVSALVVFVPVFLFIAAGV